MDHGMLLRWFVTQGSQDAGFPALGGPWLSLGVCEGDPCFSLGEPCYPGLPTEASLPFAFEHFVLDHERRELRRGGGLVAVEPKVFDLLVHLVANRERVVSKDDLINSVWGGRVVSESALTTAVNAARVALGDSGEDQRLIRTLPRKGFRFVGEVRESVAFTAPIHPLEAAAGATPALPDKPSIAVMPFANLSGDPQQEYFADGVVEDIITSLSRMRWLFVIARNSSFAYKGRAVDVKQVGRDLGVRYVLEGSIRKFGNRIRVTGQLIDASAGTHLWADRFDCSLEDLFELQDQLTASVVGAIAPKLERAEIDRANRKPTERMDAYDFYLRGMASLHQFTKRDTDIALDFFHRALEVDREFASAYAMASLCHTRRKMQGWMAHSAQEVSEGARLGRQATKFGREDANALAFAGFTLAYLALDLEDGAAYVNRAVALNANHAPARDFSGWIKVWLGEPELALEHFEHAMRLSPVDPFIYFMLHGSAHALFFAGRLDEAIERARAALREQPDHHGALRIAVASTARAGRTREAAILLARLRSFDPSLRVSNLRNKLGPYSDRKQILIYEDALREAGLPE